LAPYAFQPSFDASKSLVYVVEFVFDLFEFAESKFVRFDFFGDISDIPDSGDDDGAGYNKRRRIRK
jgi:hypothetical protein